MIGSDPNKSKEEVKKDKKKSQSKPTQNEIIFGNLTSPQLWAFAMNLSQIPSLIQGNNVQKNALIFKEEKQKGKPKSKL